jgi:PKD repeat protein
VTFSWGFGDGQTSFEQNPTLVYPDNGVYTVTLTVTDDDGGVGSITTTAIIYNLPPTISAVGAQTAKEGRTFTLAIEATDVDGDTLAFGDSTDMFDIDPSTGLIEFVPLDKDVGTREVLITVNDEDGGVATITLTLDIEDDPNLPGLAIDWLSLILLVLVIVLFLLFYLMFMRKKPSKDEMKDGKPVEEVKQGESKESTTSESVKDEEGITESEKESN